MSTIRRSRYRCFALLSLLTLLMTLVIGAMLVVALESDHLGKLQSELVESADVISVIRLMAIAAVFLAWPALICVCRRRRWISNSGMRALLGLRFRVLAWLLLIEVFLGFAAVNQLHALVQWLQT